MLRNLTVFLMVMMIPNLVYAHRTIKDDAHIKQIIIQNYINANAGQCPCPYSKSPNGQKCANHSIYYSGKKNAYCFAKDVPAQKVKAFKEINGLNSHKH